jgi:hypothetical protein
VIETKWVFKNK